MASLTAREIAKRGGATKDSFEAERQNIRILPNSSLKEFKLNCSKRPNPLFHRMGYGNQ